MLTDGVLHPPERLKNRALPGEQMEQLLSSGISLSRALAAQTGVVRSRVSVRPRHDVSLLTLVWGRLAGQRESSQDRMGADRRVR